MQPPQEGAGGNPHGWLVPEVRKLKTGLGVQHGGRLMYMVLFIFLLAIFLENCITFFYFSNLASWEDTVPPLSHEKLVLNCSQVASFESSVWPCGLSQRGRYWHLGLDRSLCGGPVLCLEALSPHLYPGYSPKL